MTAYDNTGQQIQTAHFEKLFTDQTNENSSRMFLTRVRSSRDGEHRFAYKDITEQTLFPANNTESVDHWGYWTSVRCDSLIRHINVNPSVSLYRQLDTATFKQAQFMPTSRGALCSITYPTGGSSLIDYELNSVSRMLDRSSSQYPHLIANTLNWQAGGVRVCRIVNISGERRDTVRYEYNNPGTSQSSGILMKMPRYGTTVQNTHLTSESGFMVLLNVTQIGFSDLSSCGQPRDPHIGYGYVRECRPDGSSVLYHFNDYSAFPDYYPGTDRAQFLDRTKTGPYDAVGCWGVGPTEQGIAQLLLPPYMDYMNMRGMLASKTEYDAQNVPRGRTIYHYYSINDFSAESVFSGLIWFVKMRQTFKCPILTSVTERKYENGDSLSTLTTFAYDTLGRKIQESVINNAGEHRKQYLYYSNTMTTCPSQLRRALAAVALTRTDAGGTRLLQTERYTYNSLSGNPLPTKIDTYASDAPQPASSFTSLFEAPAGYKHRTVDLTYDGIFHRLVRADLPGGAYISYTWDAAGKHILAKTVGDTPNTWSYSWKDGVGLSEVTDPTGQSLEYYYDACSRLGLVRDGLSRNIESYQYHFTNE